jgi:beta-ureidopropionase / N-carbamoyl-L-amino-acid hydrolase
MARALARLEELYAIGATRIGGSAEEDAAHELAAAWFAEAGLAVELDAAGNTFGRRGDAAIWTGSHLDSVPDGGKFDGALGVVAALEAAERTEAPLAVVAFRDEERGCAGSRACSESGRLPRAFVELHIEQGPVLEALDLPLGVVLGTFGVERSRLTWHGQAAHAGSTPMDRRRDALAGAAKLALEIRAIAREVGDGAVCTSGDVVCRPGIVTSVVETAEQLLDQRHLDAAKLARMLALARQAAGRFAAEENLEVDWEQIWRIEPILFDDGLIALADEAVVEVAGVSHRLPSGPLHDAAEVSRAGVPTVMLFVQSLRGLSHTKLEDTKREHLELAVAALDRLASKTAARLASA